MLKNNTVGAPSFGPDPKADYGQPMTDSTSCASPSDARIDLADLKQKSLRGGMVTMASQGVSIVIQLASTVILARLLSPDDYGTIAMVLAITSFAGLFLDLGLSSATIQKKDLTDAQQSNMFWLNVAMGATLTVVVAAAAPVVAWFYGKPELIPVTLALSLMFLISSLAAQHIARMVRDMKFARKATASLTGSLVTLIVAVTCALGGLAYWSLVWGLLAGAAVTTLLSFLLSRFWPSWYVKGAGIRGMLGFGANVTGFNLVNYFHRNLDNVLIGKFWGVEALGLYSKAYSLLLFPIQAIRGPLNSVAYPGLSKLQDNPAAFRAYYHRLTVATSALSMPFAACMFVVAEPLIEIALGPRWLPAASIFQILSLVAFIQPSATLRGVVVKSIGKASAYLKQGVVQAVFISAGFCIGVMWGAKGVSISYVISYYSIMPFVFRISLREAPVDFRDFLRACCSPAVAAITALLASWLIARALLSPAEHALVKLIVPSTVFAAFYAVVLATTRDGRHLYRLIYSVLPLQNTNHKVSVGQ
jgi:PST family polysaccharide transporter